MSYNKISFVKQADEFALVVKTVEALAILLSFEQQQLTIMWVCTA